LTSAALDPTGSFSGDIYKFGSFSGTLPGILAAMRLLTIKQEFIRKSSSKNSKAVSFCELLQSFNAHSGLKTDESNSFGVRFVKSTLTSCVRPRNRMFPGSFIHSMRRINLVKTDFAVLARLGWTEYCPSHHKTVDVLFNTVDEDKDSKNKVTKRQLVNITQDKRHFLHQEFRTALALSLPRIYPKSKVDFDTQLKVDPLSHTSKQVIKNFQDNQRASLVDRLNESYGLKVSLKNPKSKTKEVHYKLSRDRLLASSANLPLIDSAGKVYPSLKDLPPNVLSYFRKHFNYPEKRKPDNEPPAQEGGMEVDSAPVDGEERHSPPEKRRKLTRGQAKAAVRRSGRLAQKAK